jgi:phospholipase C
MIARVASLALVGLVSACTSSSTSSAKPLPAEDTTCAGPCPASNIKHLVIIVQENHTFDNHFGAYCKAPAGSSPACNQGPACCEAAPAADPSGAAPVVLDDDEMGGHGPDNSRACEDAEMNGGKMDAYVTASCGSARNIAASAPAIVAPYWKLADDGALADRYFQPLSGASSSNDMYFARATYAFDDNSVGPKGALGLSCGLAPPTQEYSGKTIADLLRERGVDLVTYGGGYKAMVDAVAAGTCPTAPDSCGARLAFYPCNYDPSDYPFQYFASTRDNPSSIRDLSALAADLAAGTLPAVAFVRAPGFESEHPGLRNKLSDGVTFAIGVIDQIMTSRYRASTLVLLTYDEGGGYFDHVAPPPPSAADSKPYGTRVPTLAIGPFAKKGFVSHVVMEHSSIVKLIEYNWLDQKTGQLGTRDAIVNNLGSLLDPAKTGVAIPE